MVMLLNFFFCKLCVLEVQGFCVCVTFMRKARDQVELSVFGFA